MVTDTSAMDRELVKKSRKWRSIIVGLVALMILISPFLFRSSPNLSIEASSIHFDTAKIGDILLSIPAEGSVVAQQHRLISSNQGTIILSVELGDVVYAGDIVAKIDNPEITNRLALEMAVLDSLVLNVERQKYDAEIRRSAALEVLDTAKIQLDGANRELSRVSHAFDLGIVSAIRFEQAQTLFKQSTLRVNHADKNLGLIFSSIDFEEKFNISELAKQTIQVDNLIRLNKELNVITNTNGIVGELEIQSNAAVKFGQTIMTIVNLNELEVDLSVLESYAKQVAPGMKVTLTIGGQTYDSKVVAVSPEVRNRVVSVRAQFHNAKIVIGLKQNQRVTGEIILEEVSQALFVARGPFVSTNTGNVAYVRIGDQLEKRTIKLGAMSLKLVEIKEGIEPGDIVVISSLERFNNEPIVRLIN